MAAPPALAPQPAAVAPQQGHYYSFTLHPLSRCDVWHAAYKLSACGSVPLYAATMSRSFCCCSGVCSRGLTLWMGLLWGRMQSKPSMDCKRSLVASGLDLVGKSLKLLLIVISSAMMVGSKLNSDRLHEGA